MGTTNAFIIFLLKLHFINNNRQYLTNNSCRGAIVAHTIDILCAKIKSELFRTERGVENGNGNVIMLINRPA